MGQSDKKDEGPEGKEKREYWKFTQWFRKMQNNQRHEEGEQDHDFITAVEYDATGRFLATGDKSGNIVVLESDPTKSKKTIHYSFFSEFVSHNAEFDFVQSKAVPESISSVKFGPSSIDSMYLLTANENQIKLFKVNERDQIKIQGWNIDAHAAQHYYPTAQTVTPLNTLRGKPVIKSLKVPKKVVTGRGKMPSLRKIYASDVHEYPITSLCVTADESTFLSGDNLRINLWDLNIGTHAYNVLDVKPDDMQTLSEIISSVDAHPSESSNFIYSTNLGHIMTCDLRVRALVDEPVMVFGEENTSAGTTNEEEDKQSFFNEMTQNVTAAKYSKSGKFIFSRDYMTVKLWDTAMERAPLQTINVHEYLRDKMWELYSNDLLFDPFGIGVSARGDVVTGSYSNYFHIFNLAKSTDTFIQASQQSSKVADLGRSRKTKQRLAPPVETDNKKSNRRGFNIGGLFPKKKSTESEEVVQEQGYPFDIPFETIEFSKKVIDCAWHPEKDAVAVAGQNNLYIYAKTTR